MALTNYIFHKIRIKDVQTGKLFIHSASTEFSPYIFLGEEHYVVLGARGEFTVSFA